MGNGRGSNDNLNHDARYNRKPEERHHSTRNLLDQKNMSCFDNVIQKAHYGVSGPKPKSRTQGYAADQYNGGGLAGFIVTPSFLVLQ
jgi:hypothetical protein